jgi:hypothetical protein
MAHWIINTGFGVLIISEQLLLMGLVLAMMFGLVAAVAVFEQKNRPRRKRGKS